MPTSPALDDLCPCQDDANGPTYRECCRRYHQRLIADPNAQGLMRSRYTAYAMGLTDYIMETTHREHPQYRRSVGLWRRELDSYYRSTEFLGLKILECEDLSPEMATVTFQATLSTEGNRFILQEKSIFRKIGSRWLYFAGDSSTVAIENEKAT